MLREQSFGAIAIFRSSAAQLPRGSRAFAQSVGLRSHGDSIWIMRRGERWLSTRNPQKSNAPLGSACIQEENPFTELQPTQKSTYSTEFTAFDVDLTAMIDK